jgi:cation transport protein ChaC
MPQRPRQMHLTEALLARVERMVPDGGEAGDTTELTEVEIAEEAERFLAEVRGAGFWVFAYGSLIWRPEFEFVEARPAVVHGWRRSYCLGIDSYRATRDQPGLMLALDRGGSCRGIAYRLPDDDRQGRMEKLIRREGHYREGLDTFRWLQARGGGERFRALTFYAMPRKHEWTERLPLEEQVFRLARAAGRMGSCAAYLRNTVEHLESLGIHDRYLWDMQRRVAEEIAGMAPLVDLAPQ